MSSGRRAEPIEGWTGVSRRVRRSFSRGLGELQRQRGELQPSCTRGWHSINCDSLGSCLGLRYGGNEPEHEQLEINGVMSCRSKPVNAMDGARPIRTRDHIRITLVGGKHASGDVSICWLLRERSSGRTLVVLPLTSRESWELPQA